MMNQLLLSSCDILTICIFVTIVVLIVASVYLFRPLVLWKIECASKKSEQEDYSDISNVPEKQSTQDSKEEEYKREVKRQERVLTIMERICELTRDPGTSKDIKGSYNNTEANNLWKLYQAIDSFNKQNTTNPKIDPNEKK